MVYVGLPLPPREELQKRYEAIRPIYENLLEKTNQAITAAAKENHISITVRHRLKDFPSWYGKLLRLNALGETRRGKNAGRQYIAITDMMGIRVICPFIEDVNSVSLLLQERFGVREIDNKGSDYPFHQFGYESLHFLVEIPSEFLADPKVAAVDFFQAPVCEVQVRTILQEAWAEVEHELVYKSDFSPLDEPLKRKLAALNANLSLSDIMFQEIRDYQKDFHAAIKQRRKNFYETIREHSTDDGSSSGLPKRVGDMDALPAQKTFDALLLQGLLAHNNRQYAEAIDIYSGILSEDMTQEIRAVILVHRGMAYFTSGASDAAREDFNQALELNPEYTKARYYRAVQYRIDRNFQDAFADLDECIKLEPLNLEYLTGRAETSAAAGDTASALLECQNVLNIDPDFKPAQRLLSHLRES